MRGHLFTLWALLLPWVSVAQQPFAISHGPYLQAMGTTGVDILWTTNRPAIGWVELAPDDGSHFYREERTRRYAVRDGIKRTDTLHRVRIDGLAPATAYRYRIYSQEVTGHSWGKVQYGAVQATDVYRKKPLRFTTAAPDAPSVSFAVINDIHGKNDVMRDLLGQVDVEENDLFFFNGDMASFFLDESQVFTDFMDTAIAGFAAEHAWYYARGNHETRGPFAVRFSDYFPGISGKPYFLLRRGPVCFVVLDSGEDKPDTDVEYSGIAAFDAYRDEEAAWLKEALERPEFTEAPYKVVICHMPPFGGWHGEREVATKFVPLLNAAGAQVMISGHLHRHVKQLPQQGDGPAFPILVNSNTALVKATADAQRLRIEVTGQDGKVVDTLVIDPSR